ncbi:hypothetical protein [Streptomyces sp. NBC_01294]|uniref:hypothetical protein n=1 Tax=Streptomyces sp. NBC_01294 TaxID=2903815 RepID=UPI002DD8D776|nr:hypothetical protein [Streptomyces sp. NBC_01294]WRZ57576.1 hypothetical protein OG534_14390 [Streptomyces sp. NBC_01294]
MQQCRDASRVDTEDASSGRVAAIGEPSADLLDRALVGWERFLATLQEAPDE